MINVIRPGSFTTIQDSGRWGYQAWGLPISGAMDPYAYAAANLLAGNQKGAAVLEMTQEGGMFHFDESAFAAIAGADMQAVIDDRKLPNWSSFIIPAGAVLRFGRALKGRRAYFAVQGGIASVPVMGSRSTYTAAGIGGLEGRALLTGDSLSIGDAAACRQPPYSMPEKWVPGYRSPWELSMVLGPQTGYFSEAEQQKFFRNEYIVSDMAGRMDYELAGPPLVVSEHESVSEASGWGAVEISEGGHPFIVTPDHGTTRGFSKIGYIIQADFYKIAQAAPGDKIQFMSVCNAEAVKRFRNQHEIFKALAMLLRPE